MTKEEAVKILSESIHDGSKVSWDKIVEAVHLSIEALSLPPLPSNLDEAAEGYVQTLCDRADDNLRIDTTLQSAFKAGAEWMARQGETKRGVATQDHFIQFADDTYIDLDPTMKLIPAFKLKDAEKIVVQIRKK